MFTVYPVTIIKININIVKYNRTIDFNKIKVYIKYN